MEGIRESCLRAREAARKTALLSPEEKNRVLYACAKALREDTEQILAANRRDQDQAEDQGMSEGLLDRLTLTEKRIEAMAAGMEQVAALPDPVGEELERIERPNGLRIRKVRVPFGVIGIIYEARPNVTADAFALCFKAGSACVLKGGSAALETNLAIMESIRRGLLAAGADPDSAVLIRHTDRESTREMMRQKGILDVLIPRGSAGLIRTVVENSTVPVIETGTGNCHVYVDATADFQMALDIIYNAKTQRIGVCNACESLLVHQSIAEEFLPLLKERLDEKQVEIRADEASCRLVPGFVPAAEEDWGREYLDYILSLKQVGSLDEAIAHINRYGTGHSEAIVTRDYGNAQRFLEEVDAAAVYVNASTRFTDGAQFGFGAEIGISTQKLHARGPMGLRELTTIKYIIYGDGQVRP